MGDKLEVQTVDDGFMFYGFDLVDGASERVSAVKDILLHLSRHVGGQMKTLGVAVKYPKLPQYVWYVTPIVPQVAVERLDQDRKVVAIFHFIFRPLHRPSSYEQERLGTSLCPRT